MNFIKSFKGLRIQIAVMIFVFAGFSGHAQLLEANKANKKDVDASTDKSLTLDPVTIFKSKTDSLMLNTEISRFKKGIDSLTKSIKESNQKLTQLINDRKFNDDELKQLRLALNNLKQNSENQQKESLEAIRKLLYEKHLSFLQEHKRNIENYNASLLKLKTQLAVDKRKPETSMRADIQYFLDSAYFGLTVLSDELLATLKGITSKVVSYEIYVTQIGKEGQTIATDGALQSLHKSISDDIQNFSLAFKSLETKVLLADTKIQAKRDLYSEKNKQIDYGAIPGLAAIFGQREVVPNITLIGSKIFDSRDDNLLYGELKFFTGAVSNNREIINASTLFVVETSSFGFTSNFSYGFSSKKNGRMDESKRFSINLSFNYLGKNLQPDTLNNFSVSLFLGKLGVEYLVVNKGSIYLNTCALGVVDNVEQFEKHYNNKTPFKRYTEFGFRFYLDLSADANLSLKVDLNFILQNDTVKELTMNKDVLIPNIRIGLTKAIM